MDEVGVNVLVLSTHVARMFDGDNHPELDVVVQPIPQDIRAQTLRKMEGKKSFTAPL